MNATQEAIVQSPSPEKAISSEHLTIPVVVPERTASRMLTPRFSSADIKLPAVPVPKSSLDLPPQKSDYVQVAVNSTKKLLVEMVGLGFVNPNELRGELKPAIPDYSLAYRLYWNQVAYQRTTGPQDFVYTAEVVEGMSQTDSTSISAEFGVDVKGISAKLSVTFEHSITISQEHRVSHQYQIQVPEGKVGVWTLWQLTDEIIAVDSSGNQIQYSGLWDAKFFRAQIRLPATLVTQGTERYAAEMSLFDR